jgi:hypothetical protein
MPTPKVSHHVLIKQYIEAYTNAWGKPPLQVRYSHRYFRVRTDKGRSEQSFQRKAFERAIGNLIQWAGYYKENEITW